MNFFIATQMLNSTHSWSQMIGASMALKMTSLHFQLRKIVIHTWHFTFQEKKIQYIFDGLSDFLLFNASSQTRIIDTVLLIFQLIILELGNIAK